MKGKNPLETPSMILYIEMKCLKSLGITPLLQTIHVYSASEATM